MDSIFAPAKINLTLNITDKREDGYHNLHSLTAFANVGDALHISDARPTTKWLSYSGPLGDALQAICPPEDNLLTKTKTLLENHHIELPFQIDLKKNLPFGGGIGGGSSDGAALLRYLYQKDLISNKVMQNMAQQLGADVTVCLEPGLQLMTGIGHDCEPVASKVLDGLQILLVQPNQPISTPAVFKALSAQPYQKRTSYLSTAQWESLDQQALLEALKNYGNDLLKPAQTILPVISDMIEQLSNLPGCLHANMSGSGSTCYGLFDANEDISPIAKRLQDSHHNWWIKATPFLTH